VLLALLSLSRAEDVSSGAGPDVVDADAAVFDDIVVQAPERAVLDPGSVANSVTVIDVADLPTGADVAAAIETSAGTSVQRLGGLGDWSGVSIRGSTVRQVEVLLDGVPLNPDGAGAVNLSEMPLRAFERIEVYRGGAPAELGTTAMGGAVNLVTGDSDERRRLSISAGTSRTGLFGADLGWKGQGTLPWDGWIGAEGMATAGDFRSFDDRGTVYTQSDDVIANRVNNDKAQLNLQGRIRMGGARSRLTVLNTRLDREVGVPGPTGRPALSSRYAIARNLGVLQWDGTAGAGSGTVRLWNLWRHEQLTDELGEVGVGAQVRNDVTGTWGAHSHGAWAVGEQLKLGVVGEGRVELFQGDDRLLAAIDDSRQRRVGKLALSATAWGLDGRLAVSPVLSGTAMQSVSIKSGTVESREVLAAASPRIGVLFRPVGDLAFKANAGRYFRAPDTTELFGDRGAFRGNPDLLPERGWQADVGARYAARDGVFTGTAELAAFANIAQDAIVYGQNAQGIATPANVGSAIVRGVEAAGALQVLERIDLAVNMTATHSSNGSADPAYAGKQLPRTPAIELHTRVGVAPHAAVRLGHGFSYTAGTYHDATNWFRQAPRAFHEVFLTIAAGPWSAELDVRNAGDRLSEQVLRNPLDASDQTVPVPITDFWGYPLPGRTVLLTLSWQPRGEE